MAEVKEITKEEFQAYEAVRASGITNMYAVPTVEVISGLDRSTILAIMEKYSELNEKYPGVRGGLAK
ncbi:hypothetical protein LCGC14_3161110 [marine sediment metagenome]|uniref:Uncharacterized protein n=1 Tax=marine sediment metagenome TaxID=412755 RepID=A0A0F8XY09_9ZZZZ